MFWSIFSAILLGVLSFGMIKANYYYIPHNEYYADYVTSYGVPKGVYPITYEILQKRSSCYQITTLAGRVTELRFVNSKGMIIPQTHTERKDRPVHAKYYYQDNNSEKLSRVEYFDLYGRVVFVQEYSSNLSSVSFRQKDDSLYFLAASTTNLDTGMININNFIPSTKKSDIVRNDLVYDEKGHVIKVLFRYDERGTPASDNDGVAGFSYELDEVGRIIKVTFLDEDEKPCVSKQGIAGKRYMYDAKSNLFYTEYFDGNEKPIRNQDGWMKCAAIFDGYGNVIQEKFLNEEGQASYSKIGYSVANYYYDENGNNTYIVCLDPSMLLKVITTHGFAIVEKYYDSLGRIIKENSLGKSGERILNQQGFSSVEISYDKEGRPFSYLYLDTEERPIKGLNGFSKVENIYDDKGNMLEGRFFFLDEDNKLQKDWSYKYSFKYNENHCISEIRCLDKLGNATFDKDGVSKVKLIYDNLGSLVRVENYDTNDNAMLCSEGFSIVEYTYYENSNTTEARYYGIDGKRILAKNGTSGFITTNNEYGNNIDFSYIGTDDTPIIGPEGYAKSKMKYNSIGQIIDCRFYDEFEKLITSSFGYAGYSKTFDEKGNTLGQVFFDESEKLIVSPFGYARYEAKYDEFSRGIYEAYYGSDNELCLCPSNYAIYTVQYEILKESRTKIEICLGIDKKPIVCSAGFAKRKTLYNKDGSIQKTECYDNLDNLIDTIK